MSTLFIVEGDSAAGSLTAIRSASGRTTAATALSFALWLRKTS